MKGVYTQGRSFRSVTTFCKELSKKATITFLVLMISFVSMAQKIDKLEQIQNGKASALYGPGAYTITASAASGNQGDGYSASTTVSNTESANLICGVQWPYESTNEQPACGNDNINILQLATIGGTAPYTYQVYLTNPTWLINGPNTGTMVDGINEFNFYVGDGASTIQFIIKDKNGYTTKSSVDMKGCQKL